MKTQTSTSIPYRICIMVIFQIFTTQCLIAQKTDDCVQCGSHSNLGDYSSTLGQNISSSGFASFASGYQVYSTNAFSFAHGKFLNASGTNSVIFGSYANAINQHNMVLGHGTDNNNRLENNIGYSLMIGFNSSKPTFFVSESSGSSSTGKIGIGNVTAPQAKLHIREDDNYDTASIFIQASNIERSAYLWLGTKNYGLQKKDASLEFLTDGDYLFNQGNIKLDNHYQFEVSHIQSNTKDGLSLFTSHNSGIFIDAQGQVGINNTRPGVGVTLDVSGKLRTQSLQIPLANPLGEPKDIAGYVLQSRDNYGNVRWTPQSSLDDGDWTKNGEDVYHLDGQVGIGTSAPDDDAKLEVAGLIKTSGLKLADNNQGAGKLLQSDENGVASWVNPEILSHWKLVDGCLVTNRITGVGVPEGTTVYGSFQVGKEFTFWGSDVSHNKVIANNYRWQSKGETRIYDGAASSIVFDHNTGNITLNAAGDGSANSPITWQQMTFTKDGRLGIGTNTPGQELEVAGNIAAQNITVNGFALADNNQGAGKILQSDAQGNATWVYPPTVEDDDWTISGANIYRPSGSVAIGTNNITSDAALSVNGKVLIGNHQTNMPAGYKLFVEEGILSERLSVKTVSNWADDVFSESYDLFTIAELATFINTNKHLPDVPTETEIKSKGYDIAEMDALLLKKIEELTLYVIELKKENFILKESILKMHFND